MATSNAQLATALGTILALTSGQIADLTEAFDGWAVGGASVQVAATLASEAITRQNQMLDQLLAKGVISIQAELASESLLPVPGLFVGEAYTIKDENNIAHLWFWTGTGGWVDGGPFQGLSAKEVLIRARTLAPGTTDEQFGDWLFAEATAAAEAAATSESNASQFASDAQTAKMAAQAAQAATEAALGTKQSTSEKNQPSGYAGLDGAGKILTSLLPAIAISETNEVASQSAMLALTAQVGDVAIRTDENKTYILAAEPASTLANWKWMRTPTDVVLAVAGLTGTITAAALKTALAIAISDVSGLQTALNAKHNIADSLQLAAGKTVKRPGSYGGAWQTGNLASYDTMTPTVTGAIIFTAPANLNVMHILSVKSHLYNSTKVVDFDVHGYSYIAGPSWINSKVAHRGSYRPEVRWAYNAAGRPCLILGDVTTVWDYPHIAIVGAVFGYHTSSTYAEGWTSSLVTDLTGYTQITTPGSGHSYADVAPWTGVTGKPTSLDTLATTASILTGVVSSTNNVNGDGNNFTVNTTAKSTALYAFGVQRSGVAVGGFLIDGSLTGVNGAFTGNVSAVQGTFTGTLTAPNAVINGPSGTDRGLYYRSGGSNRWGIYANTTAEGGGNAGSNLAINRYDDTGASLGPVLYFGRSTGVATFSSRPIFGSATPWDSANFDPSLKANLASPALTGIPTAPTAALGTNNTQIATMAALQAAIAAIINMSPADLDTLKEIADRLVTEETEQDALIVTVAGKLAKASNLSDLTNVATARSNLGLAALAVLATVGTAQIDNDAVTFAKVQNIATARFLGRVTASSGDVEELTAAQARTLLGLTTADVSGLDTALSGKLATTAKASASEIQAGTEDTKFVTAKGLADADGYVAVTANGAFTLDFSTGRKFKVTLTGNSTMSITGLTKEISGVIRFQQDGTGGRTLTLNAAIKKFGTYTLSTAANAVDRCGVEICNGVAELTALEKGLA